MSASYKTRLPLVTNDAVTGAAKTMLDAVRQKLGFTPNMYAAMANQPGLLQTYMLGYDLFRQEAGFSPAEQEVVFLTISYENNCEYCMSAHSLLADNMSKVPVEVTDAIRAGGAIHDVRLGALRDFVRAMMKSRGRPSAADAEAFLGAGYTEQHVLGVILAIGVKTFSNYANHIFETPLDKPFLGRAWRQYAA